MYKIYTLFLSALLLPVSVQATTWTSSSSNCSGSGSSSSCTFDSSDASNNALATGYTSTKASTGSTVASDTTFGDFSRTKIQYYDGNGLSVGYSSSNSEHGLDNENNSVDAAIFSFGSQLVSLNEIAIDWYSGDTDMTVMAYDPNVGNTSKGDTSTVAGRSFTDLLDYGWKRIGEFSNVSSNAGDKTSFTTTVASSFWLVSAYVRTGTSTWTDTNDQFKILSLSGSVVAPPPTAPNNQVPTPSSIVLIVLGIIGWRLSNQSSIVKRSTFIA